MYEKKIPIPGHYVDAYLTSKLHLGESKDDEKRKISENFSEIKLRVNEQKIITAILEMYNEKGIDAQSIDKGINFTLYRLCKKMRLPQDAYGRFGSKILHAVLGDFHGLTRKTFTIVFTKFKRQENGKKIFSVVVRPNCPLIQITYSASDVTEKELIEGRFQHKVDKMHAKFYEGFWNKGYFFLLDGTFFVQLKELLKKQGKRITQYHYNFALWILKHQKGSRKFVEINVDKLAIRLKIPFDSNHLTRVREKVRELYQDFIELGYIDRVELDVLAKSGFKKDIIHIKGNSVVNTGVSGL